MKRLIAETKLLTLPLFLVPPLASLWSLQQWRRRRRSAARQWHRRHRWRRRGELNLKLAGIASSLQRDWLLLPPQCANSQTPLISGHEDLHCSLPMINRNNLVKFQIFYYLMYGVIEKQEILPEFWFFGVHLDQIDAAQLSMKCFV